MNQANVFDLSPSMVRKGTNPDDRPSRVREVVQKFDMLSKSNGSSFSTPGQINPNESSSSSTDSTVSENGIEGQTSTPESATLPKRSHVSTATIDIRPPILPTRRVLPAIPLSVPESNHDEEPMYVNDDHDQTRKFSDVSLDDANETEGISSTFSYTKLTNNRRPPPRLRTDSYRNGVEKLSSSVIQNRLKTTDADSIGLEIDQSTSRDPLNNNQRISSMSTNYETTEHIDEPRTMFSSFRRVPPPIPPSPRPPFNKSFLQIPQHDSQDELQVYSAERTLPLSNFLLELAAFAIVFIVGMVLVTAIREDETKLRTTMQIVYSYIYLVSIIWMIWCIFDIIKFRRTWLDLTANVHDQEEYMDMTERYSSRMFYFTDPQNTGGLFMRVGAGLLCMGGLVLTVIEIAKTVARMESEEITMRASLPSSGDYNSAVTITKLITYALRFLFHCVQFSFLFRYSNLVINHYHLLARIGLTHVVIANFCTWFEAIVIETVEQMHNAPDTSYSSTSDSPYSTTANETFVNTTNFIFLEILAAANTDGTTNTNRTALEIIYEIESTMAVYLYPCLIEYSLIALTVFFIMWKNVGKDSRGSFQRFGDRNIFTINCARASRGLLIGGIILLITVVTLIPTYLFDEQATSISQITGLVLVLVALFTVGLSYIYTTKLFYDHHAHVDVFDQALIFITTAGDFAYSTFRLFASIFSVESESKLPFGFEISFSIFAILQTFLQSAFIMDALKRRTRTKQENRQKPGRELITALLLMNLALWLHDSLSAKRVRLNPSQVAYYNVETWAIIQAFTSPLSIFYRFHSSVCLADIWQEVYQDHGFGGGGGGKHPMIPLISLNGAHDH